MIRKIFTTLFLLYLTGISCYAAQVVSNGKLTEYHNFNSEYISQRDVCVWVPDGYSTDKKYDVVYMHDGQMLFDANTTWNKQEWKIDEIAGKLINEKLIKECIFVAISNIPETRYGDFFPQKTLKYLPENSVIPNDITFKADNYLKFIVNEVKPFIDKNYSTYTTKEHTFVMGSSMGGLISLYALCEYPDVFGGAGCISTHVPMVMSKTLPNSQADIWAEAFRKYLKENLPESNSRKIYMDRGDQTLDRFYPKFQDLINVLMISNGWNSEAWISNVFPGAAHTENDWADRLKYPLQFLLGKE